MTIIAWLAAGLFCFGYVLIALEQKFSTHKSAVAMLLGVILWLLTALYFQGKPDEIKHALEAAAGEIFSIVVFLLAAMALVEILVHYRFFDLIRAKLLRLKLNDKQQFLVLMALTFCFSALLDNIAITIAMLQIARRFFTGKNLIVAACGIVIAANAGGAWSPIGDVTTVLLWLAEKFTAGQIIGYAFVPSLTIFTVSTLLLYRKLNSYDFDAREPGDTVLLSFSEKLIVGTVLASFSMPFVMNVIGLPPYMGLLFGLGIAWAMIEVLKGRSRKPRQSHLTANIEELLSKVDVASIQYIIGILLAVSALATLGVLAFVSEVSLGSDPSMARIIAMNIVIGLLSMIVDNTSLVVMAIDVIPTDAPVLWALTAIAAGTGGSALVISSAAGVVAMGSLKQLNFANYIRTGTGPALVGFAAGIGVWLIQYTLFFA